MSFCVAGVALCDIPTCLITCRNYSKLSKLEEVLYEMLVFHSFSASTCLVSSRWFSCGFAVSMGEAAKPLFFEGFQAGCHVVLRGRRGLCDIPTCLITCRNYSKLSKLEEVLYEMLVFHSFSASTCLGSSLWFSCGVAVSMGEAAKPLFFEGFQWGKLQNLSFSKVSKQVVMSFCVAGVVLCDIPTCLITCQKCQNWRKSRTKSSFFCTHVSRLESLVFLWRRRVYGGSSALHTLDFTPTIYTLDSTLLTRDFTLHTLHSTLLTLHSTLDILHSRLYTLHSSLYTPHFSLYTPHSTLYTFHSTLHTAHFTLHIPHSTIYTLDS